MRDDRPSSTAAFVAAARAAIHAKPTIRDFDDPFAEALLPRGFTLEDDSAALRMGVRLVRRLTRRGAHIIGLRTVAIDEGIRTAPALEQLVILGAGLDARAWRMPELEDVDVYEVDHPSTQRYKRERAANFPERPRHEFVSVDFERESLDERLDTAGHDVHRPTVWVWEGVTMYLNLDAIEGTLSTLRKRSAPDSQLLVTYLPPTLARAVVGIGTRVLGERFQAELDAPTVKRLLEKHGFELERDEDGFDWHSRWALAGVGLADHLVRERLATARVSKTPAP